MISDKTAEQLELALVGTLRDLVQDPASLYVRKVVAHRLRSIAIPTAEGMTPCANVLTSQPPEAVAFSRHSSQD